MALRQPQRVGKIIRACNNIEVGIAIDHPYQRAEDDRLIVRYQNSCLLDRRLSRKPTYQQLSLSIQLLPERTQTVAFYATADVGSIPTVSIT